MKTWFAPSRLEGWSAPPLNSGIAEVGGQILRSVSTAILEAGRTVEPGRKKFPLWKIIFFSDMRDDGTLPKEKHERSCS